MNYMKKKVSALLGFGIIITYSLANTAWAECANVKGKIANNAQTNGTTLGVASLKLDNQPFKCAVSGVPQPYSPDGPNFRHTLVCDDKVGDGEAQSQITFNTFFTSEPVPTGIICPGGTPSFTFEELSIPDPTTARGAFTGADPSMSSITITGDFNCNGGINMTFNGMMCFTAE